MIGHHRARFDIDARPDNGVADEVEMGQRRTIEYKTVLDLTMGAKRTICREIDTAPQITAGRDLAMRTDDPAPFSVTPDSTFAVR